MQFAVVIENAGTNYSAYVPDLPGCVAAGDTLQDVKDLIREAIALHIAGLREDGLPIPEPSTHVIDIDVKVA
jgi:predicted RNase H-like HicB family nuclease